MASPYNLVSYIFGDGPSQTCHTAAGPEEGMTVVSGFVFSLGTYRKDDGVQGTQFYPLSLAPVPSALRQCFSTLGSQLL